MKQVSKPNPVNRLYLAGACALLGALALYSLFLGVHEMTLVGLLHGEARQTQIFLVSRVPRLIAIITAGMGMSVVGLIMQQLARNKFVTPSTAGTVEAASLGILVATSLGTVGEMFGAIEAGLRSVITGAKRWACHVASSTRFSSGKQG